MTGLVLRLAPRERILINGTLIENGNRSNRLCVVTPNTAILRLRAAETGDRTQIGPEGRSAVAHPSPPAQGPHGMA